MSERVTVVVPGALGGERVDRVVSLLTGLPRSDAAAIVDRGAVRIAGRPVTARSRRVAEGETVDIEVPPRPGGPDPDPSVAVPVVHADDAVIVVDKPAGLVVHPGAGNPAGTLVNGLLARYPDLAGHGWPDPGRPGVVHRLDKGTSGLLMVARTPAALASLSAQLADRTVERRYLVLVWGDVANVSGVIDAPIGRSPSEPTRMAVRAEGRRAVTRYEVLRRCGSATLLQCALDTGRTHQIRVHLAAIGHPVVGDDRYDRGHGGRGRRVRRPFLHAAVLGFDHPTSGARMRFESDLPAELRTALQEV